VSAADGDHSHDEHAHGGHGHEGHSHGVSANADRGKLSIALALILGFMAFEVSIGITAHSLALLSDAAAIGPSLLAIRLAATPAKGAMTLGLKPTGILSAQFNGATLLVLGLLIIYEGGTRPSDPRRLPGRPCNGEDRSSPRVQNEAQRAAR
jgi:cobalt-zinc-cadmium efflux system protein